MSVDDASCDIPSTILSIFQSPTIISEAATTLSPLFSGSLMHHQYQALDFTTNRSRAMLALDMGLGKTVIGIAYALLHLPALIVCPASLVDSWMEHIDRFAPTCSATSEYLDASHEFTVVSYHQLSKLTSFTYSCLVADEAHYLKHAGSSRSKLFAKIQRRVPRTLLLTGTPAQRHCDIWHLLHLMDPSRFAVFHARYEKLVGDQFCFASRYCVPQPVWLAGHKHGYKYTTNQHTEELRLICARYILRMTKQDVLTLPAIYRERVDLSPISRVEQLEHTANMDRVELLRSTRGNLYADAELLQLCHETAIRKVPLVQQVMARECTGTERCIVFFYHRDVGQLYRDWFDHRGLKYVYIDGRTPMSERLSIINQWKADATIQFGLFSLCATSTGLNLQFCTRVICTELTFHCAHHVQSESRIHRIGQTKDVHIMYMIRPGSTDEILWSSLNRKIDIETRLFGTTQKEEGWDIRPL